MNAQVMTPEPTAHWWRASVYTVLLNAAGLAAGVVGGAVWRVLVE